MPKDQRLMSQGHDATHHYKEVGMSASTINDQIIQAVFAADDEAKARALAILEGKEDPTVLDSDLRLPSSETVPLLMGMGESATLLGVSRATLWRMIKDGRLEKVEIYHNSFRLRRADIMELVRTRTAPRWRTRKKEQVD